MTTSVTATSDQQFEQRYRAVVGRDPRFDGVFFTAVTSTGIYCRPSCPAKTPRRDRVRFYPTAAAAQRAGFRACKRCVPGAVPGSPEWDLRGDVAGRAMRMIDDGLVDREGVPGLARRLGYGERQLRRILLADLGAAPLTLARAQRAGVARVLLQTTELPIIEVGLAAGFASLRQFNATMREIYDATPTELRARGRREPDEANSDPLASEEPGATRIELRLTRREPYDFTALLRFLGPRSIPGVEEVIDEAGETLYRRSLGLPAGPAIAEVRDDGTGLHCSLLLAAARDLSPAVGRLRRLLDLDADPVAVREALGQDPALGPLVDATPGRRSPGAVDGLEVAVRAVVGQQISVAAAARIMGRVVERLGSELPVPAGSVVRLFPEPARLAEADDADLPVPAPRRSTIRALAVAVATGRLVLGAGTDRKETVRWLLEIPGIGPWTAGYVALRALGDPDVLLSGDLGVRRAAHRLGLPEDPAALAATGVRWAPWRSYATHHLWASLADADRQHVRPEATLP